MRRPWPTMDCCARGVKKIRTNFRSTEGRYVERDDYYEVCLIPCLFLGRRGKYFARISDNGTGYVPNINHPFGTIYIVRISLPRTLSQSANEHAILLHTFINQLRFWYYCHFLVKSHVRSFDQKYFPSNTAPHFSGTIWISRPYDSTGQDSTYPLPLTKYSITPLIRTLVIRIGFARRVNLSRILQN
jgi:hypothetical protein